MSSQTNLLYLVVNASGWILGVKMVEEEEVEEHQDQNPEGEFPKEVWKWAAGERQPQGDPADVVGPRTKEEKWSHTFSHPPIHIVSEDAKNTLLKSRYS